MKVVPPCFIATRVWRVERQYVDSWTSSKCRNPQAVRHQGQEQIQPFQTAVSNRSFHAHQQLRRTSSLLVIRGSILVEGYYVWMDDEEIKLWGC